MPTNPGRDFDILALAEDVVAGRRSLDNVIDQIAVGTPDDRARRAAVADLQDTVRALAAVRGHAAATASASVQRSGPDVAPAVGRTTSPPRVRSRGGAFGPAGAAAAGFTAIAGVLVVVLILASLRPTTVGPSASLPGGAVASSPGASGGVVSSSSPSAGPSASSGPSPTAGASGSPVASAAWTPDAPRFVFWTRTDTAVTLWRWDPASGPGSAAVADDRDMEHPVFAERRRDRARLTGRNADRRRRACLRRPRVARPDARVRRRPEGCSGRRPPTSRETIDLAWSIDGTMLALGAIPAPWTVVTFSPNGAADAATYNLTADGAYRLLAFSADDARLIGYETSGEAEFWDKPVALDLARGTVAPLETWPAGMDTNATGPVEQINPDGGSVLAQPGRAKGTSDWVIRSPSGDQPLNLDPGAQVQWSSADAIDWVVMKRARRRPANPRPRRRPRSGRVLRPTPPAARTWPLLPRGPGDYGTLVSSHGAVAVVALRVQATYPGGDPGWRDFTRRGPGLGGGRQGRVAGRRTARNGTVVCRLGRRRDRIDAITLDARRRRRPRANRLRPHLHRRLPRPLRLPRRFPPLPRTRIADAPDAAFWSTDVVPGKLTVWRWSPSRGPGLTDRLDIDTWTSGTFSTQVVVSPDGRRIAVTEFGGPTSRLNRTRVLDNQGRLLWTSPDGADPTPDMVWSPDGTELALGAVPSPWTVLVFSPSGQVESEDLRRGRRSRRLPHRRLRPRRRPPHRLRLVRRGRIRGQHRLAGPRPRAGRLHPADRLPRRDGVERDDITPARPHQRRHRRRPDARERRHRARLGAAAQRVRRILRPRHLQ